MRRQPDGGAAATVTTRRTLMAAAGLAMLADTGASPAAAPPPAAAPLVVDRDRTIAETLVLSAAMQVVVAEGATLTLLGDLVAPAERIFLGKGRVDLQRSRVLAARPEWWGAVADDEAVDSRPAIAAALAAHPATQLGLGDYHLFDTLRIDQANRRLWGIGRTSGSRGTRLVAHRRDSPVVVAGLDEAPASINDYVRGVDLRWIELARSAPARPTTGDDPLAPTGLAIRHVLDAMFEGLRSSEHAIGYSIRGAVRTFLHDCTAFRSLFTDPARDAFIGFDMDGRRPPIPTGANASIYLTDCNARTGNRPSLPLSIGCRLLGAFSDTFLTRFETTELANGIVIDGAGLDGGRIDEIRHRFAQVDVHLDTPVLDRCGDAGIVVAHLSDRAMIDIRSPWLALAAGGDAALRMTDCGGATTITGGQLVGVSPATSRGAVLTRASGVALAGTKMTGFARPIQATGSNGLDLTVAIVAALPDCTTAVCLDSCRDGYVRPRLLGVDGPACVGVAMTACVGVTVDTAGLGTATVQVDGRTVPAAVLHASGARLLA